METSFFHICTREDHPIVFRNDEEFRSGINLLALCLCLFPDVRLYAFEMMSNHFHLLMSGDIDVLKRFIRFYIKQLEHYFRSEGYAVDLSDLRPTEHPIEDAEHLRNVIVYIHRNGSAVSSDCTPFSYQWGTGRYYFNPEAEARYRSCRQSASMRQRQLFSHSRKFDNPDRELYTIDGYISPMCFCDIREGESIFATQRQYLYFLTKNVEAYKQIALEIGDTITLSDYELYSVVARIGKERFGKTTSDVLSPDERMELARTLHHEYNAGNKQICRVLKLPISSVNMMFPGSAR